jgi:hypothetical protein
MFYGGVAFLANLLHLLSLSYLCRLTYLKHSAAIGWIGYAERETAPLNYPLE